MHELLESFKFVHRRHGLNGTHGVPYTVQDSKCLCRPGSKPGQVGAPKLHLAHRDVPDNPDHDAHAIGDVVKL